MAPKAMNRGAKGIKRGTKAAKAIPKKTTGKRTAAVSAVKKSAGGKKIRGGSKQSTGRVTKKNPRVKQGSGTGRKPGTY